MQERLTQVYSAVHTIQGISTMLLVLLYANLAYPAQPQITSQDSSSFPFQLQSPVPRPSLLYLNISQHQCLGSSSLHGLEVCLYYQYPTSVPHMFLYQPSDSRDDEESQSPWENRSPTSLSCAPRCGPLPHPLSAGNYTHLKPITTSKGTGMRKRSGVFPLVPRSTL